MHKALGYPPKALTHYYSHDASTVSLSCIVHRDPLPLVDKVMLWVFRKVLQDIDPAL